MIFASIFLNTNSLAIPGGYNPCRIGRLIKVLRAGLPDPATTAPGLDKETN